MMTELIGQQLGHYWLQSLLGRGGFADVYLGEHIHLKNVAAIKVLHELAEDMQEAFLNEARILALLLHPHVIRVLDFGIEAGIAYLVMDYAPGGTLRQRHTHDAKLPVTTVVDYVRQIGDGLQFAHDQKLIHRDLKPANVLVGSRGDLLLADFGLALIARSTRSLETLVHPAGTAAYIAPEQLEGKPQFASDQYALGIMAYEWLCGTPPFQGTLTEICNQHISVPPAPLCNRVPGLPRAVEQVVLRSLAKDPDHRYSCVKDFVYALQTASETAQRGKVSPHETARGPALAVPLLQEYSAIPQTDPHEVPISALHTFQPQKLPAAVSHILSLQQRNMPLSKQASPIRSKTTNWYKRISVTKIFPLMILTLLVIIVISVTSLYTGSLSVHKLVGHPLAGSASQTTGTSSATQTAVRPVNPSVSPTNPVRTSRPTVAPVSSTPSVTAVACPPTLLLGSEGFWVRTLQSSLNTQYNNRNFSNTPLNFFPPLQVNGIFGLLTTSAVEDYQSSQGLLVDGIVGPKTWHALGKC